MKKLTLSLYIALSVFIFLFIFAVFLYDTNPETRRASAPIHLMYWEDYSITTSEDLVLLYGTIVVDKNQENVLCFYTAHQDIVVHINGEQVYQFPLHNNHVFSKTSGYSWNFVPLNDTFNNITIEITTPYNYYMDWVPEFMIGDTLSLSTAIINSSIFPFIICVIIFGLGVCMIGYWVVIRQRLQFKKNLLYLGVFACLLSIWSINELRITTLILHNNIVCSYVAFFTLMLLPIPFALFVKSFFDDDHLIWQIYCVIDVLQIFVCLILQLFKIYDLRETLWTSHIMILSLAAIIMFYSFHGFHRDNFSTKIIVHLVCMFFCVIMLLLDLIAYYFSFWDANQFGRLGFLTYFIVLGIYSTQESALLIKLGQKANTYQHLAYTDQMTRLSNRTAFEQAFTALSCQPEDVGIIDLDLNNLKRTNDSQGHNEGDKYITLAAQCIHEVFHLIGKTYRVGGDEFVVLIENASSHNIDLYLSRLDRVVAAYSHHIHADYMEIAHGYAIFDANLDRGLKDTYNRADKNMYSNKKDKKDEA